MKAKEKLLSMAHEKELESFCLEIPAKADYHRFLIGKKGANVQKVSFLLRQGFTPYPPSPVGGLVGVNKLSFTGNNIFA